MLLDRLNLTPELGQRFTANQAEHLRVAPLAMQPARAEAAFEHAPFIGQQAQRVFHLSGIKGKTVHHLAQREWAMGTRIAADQFENRVGYRLHQSGSQPRRQRNAQPIAIACGILRGNQAALAGNAQLQQSAGANQAIHMPQKIG